MVSLYVQHHKSWDYNNGDNDNDDVANDSINNDNKYQKMIAIIVTIKNFRFLFQIYTCKKEQGTCTHSYS